jgi:hypothetical protein
MSLAHIPELFEDRIFGTSVRYGIGHLREILSIALFELCRDLDTPDPSLV